MDIRIANVLDGLIEDDVFTTVEDGRIGRNLRMYRLLMKRMRIGY